MPVIKATRLDLLHRAHELAQELVTEDIDGAEHRLQVIKQCIGRALEMERTP